MPASDSVGVAWRMTKQLIRSDEVRHRSTTANYF